MHRPLYAIPLLSVAVLTGGGLVACQGGRPTAAAPRPDGLELHDGDLLFQLSERGSAITDVTTGIDALPVEHVGIYLATDCDGRLAAAGIVPPCVLEAIPEEGVTLTPLDTFLARSVADGEERLPLVLVGRVTQPDFDAELSLASALAYLGTPYDSLFMPDDRAIYCSELVQKSYVTRLGREVFAPIPMTFRDATGEILPHWEEFYMRLGLVVPEGEPGSNPGELSRRANVEIIARMF